MTLRPKLAASPISQGMYRYRRLPQTSGARPIPNLPVGPGDRIFTDSDGRAEIQVGQTYVRIGPNSDVTLVDDSAFNINFGIAQGSIHLHSFGLWPRQLLDISTPNGNAEFGNAGDLRVDVMPTDGATVFTNLGQFADITAAGDFRQELDYGQSLEVAGSNPVSPQWLQPAGPDDLDSWSQQRDQQLSRVASFQYVSPDIPGAADLDANGDWQPADGVWCGVVSARCCGRLGALSRRALD